MDGRLRCPSLDPNLDQLFSHAKRTMYMIYANRSVSQSFPTHSLSNRINEYGIAPAMAPLLHPPQEVTLSYALPPRHARTLREFLPPLQTHHGIVARTRQVGTLLVERDVLGHVFLQAFLLAVVLLALLFGHCWEW
jgi:hypothetical protein